MSTRTPLNLSKTKRAELERLSRRPSTPQALAARCRVVLLDDREDMTDHPLIGVAGHAQTQPPSSFAPEQPMFRPTAHDAFLPANATVNPFVNHDLAPRPLPPRTNPHSDGAR